MSDLKQSVQKGSGFQGGRTDPGTARGEQESNQDAQFGTAERGTRGKNRDADRSGQSKNQGHGHAREDRESSRD